MDPRHEDSAGVDLERLAQQVVESLMAGITPGEMAGYDTRDYEAVYCVAHGHYAQGRYLDALKLFGFLARNNPLERRYLNAFASSLQMQKLYEPAIEFYGMAAVLDIDDPKPNFHAAECLLALGRRDDARTALHVVCQQCASPAQHPIRQRAQAVLELLDAPHGAQTDSP